MARKDLQGRDNWQTESGPGGKAGVAEQNLIAVFKEAFKGTDYVISDHPNNLKHLYENVVLSPETTRQIFNPDAATMKNAQSRGWGVSPDFSITNRKTGKILFGEIKMAGSKEKTQALAVVMRMNECASYSHPD